LIQVLDASVVVKWFVNEAGHEQSIDILDQVVDAPRRFAVPDLIWYELTHVLGRAAGDRATVRERLQRVMLLGIPCFTATPERCLAAMRLAARLGLAGYDAHYVVLASELEGRWVTFDRKAATLVRPRTRVRLLHADVR
jgi:predicted nucleic acid-binding protein